MYYQVSAKIWYLTHFCAASESVVGLSLCALGSNRSSRVEWVSDNPFLSGPASPPGALSCLGRSVFSLSIRQRYSIDVFVKAHDKIATAAVGPLVIRGSCLAGWLGCSLCMTPCDITFFFGSMIWSIDSVSFEFGLHLRRRRRRHVRDFLHIW